MIRVMLYKKPLNLRKLCKPNAWSRFCHVSIVNMIFFLSLRALWYFHIYLRYLPLFDLTIINTHHIQIYFQNPRSTIQNLHFFINFISVFQDPPFQNLHFPLTSYLFQVLPKIHFHELHFGFKIHHFKTSISRSPLTGTSFTTSSLLTRTRMIKVFHPFFLMGSSFFFFFTPLIQLYMLIS